MSDHRADRLGPGESAPVPLDSFPALNLAPENRRTIPQRAIGAGEQTAPFTPTWTGQRPASNGRYQGRRRGAPEAPPAPRVDNRKPCRCGMCPKPDPDCKSAILSCAPGVVTRMSRERVRNGQWEDIPAILRAASLRVQRPAVDRMSQIHAEAEHGRLDMDMLFDRTPGLHAHQALAAGLRLAERVLAAQLQARERGEKPRTIAEMGAAVDVTAAIAAERMVA